MLLFHHCRPLDSVSFGIAKPNPRHADPDFKGAYFWLKREVGFYPLFMAVGKTEDDLRLTGYQDNWWEDGVYKYAYRKGRRFINGALFSFSSADGIFMDFAQWHIAINNCNGNRETSDYEKRLIFKPSWSRANWLKHARDGHSVQLVVPELYLPAAGRVWAKDRNTKTKLEAMGFMQVEVSKLSYM
ncbi:MAG: hypothetical protein HYT12_02335 [Candidatus Liptonbacteria bacterium]|nr:hypothetical protein [Candidatus Liptonbacteria bacterium]